MAVYELEAENRRYHQTQKNIEIHQHTQHTQKEEQSN